MCVNNLTRVGLDSGEARIRTRDLLIASYSVLTTRPPSHTYDGERGGKFYLLKIAVIQYKPR